MDKLTTEQIERIRELETERDKLRAAFEQACGVAEEFAGTLIRDLAAHGETLDDVDQNELETMRRNRKELI